MTPDSKKIIQLLSCHRLICIGFIIFPFLPVRGQQIDSVQLPEIYNLTTKLYDSYFQRFSLEELELIKESFYDPLEDRDSIVSIDPLTNDTLYAPVKGTRFINLDELKAFTEYIYFIDEPFRIRDFDLLSKAPVNKIKNLFKDQQVVKRLANISADNYENDKDWMESCDIIIPVSFEEFINKDFSLAVDALLCPKIGVIQDTILVLKEYTKTKTLRTLTGSVTDHEGVPLPAAAIRVANSNIGTITDIDGNYKINIPAGSDAAIIISYIGYENRVIEFGTSDKIDIVLEVGDLEEIVIVGYAPGVGRDKQTPLSSYPSAGGIPSPISFTSKLVDGASQFLVNRVKEELIISFFEKMFKKIQGSVELQYLFPNTLSLLNTEDFLNTPHLGMIWMEAFRRDIENINSHLDLMLLMEPSYQNSRDTSYNSDNDGLWLNDKNFVQDRPELIPIQIYQYTQLLLKNLSDSGSLNNPLELPVEGELKKRLKLLNHVLKNLQTRDKKELITQDTYEALFLTYGVSEASSLMKYFTALLYQKDPEVFRVHDLEIDISEEYESFTKLIDEIFRLYTNYFSKTTYYQKLIADIKQKDQVDDIEKYRLESAFDQAMISFNNLLAFAFRLPYFNNLEEYYKSHYFKYYKNIPIKTIQLIRATDKRDYAGILLNAVQVIKPILEAMSNSSDQDSTDSKFLKTIPKLLTFYGGMMVDFLYADNASDVNSLLEKYAAPNGSYRTKRLNNFTISLSAYPGVYLGMENLQINESYSVVSGVTAPIGFSLDWGNRFLFWSKEGHSTSLFLPIIDIGASFSYRWSNDENSGGFPNNIQFSQIISPGIYVAWGIPNAPLSIMAGAQYTPELRDVFEAGTSLESNTIRFGINLNVDIPIFFLHRNID